MFHGLTHESIYAAAHTVAMFEGSNGEIKEISGTSFSLIVNDKHVLVTNRHMVDLNFGRSDGKYVGYTLKHLVCKFRGRDAEDGSLGSSQAVYHTDNP